jgi:2-dehydro-3-deoxygluconokinase
MSATSCPARDAVAIGEGQLRLDTPLGVTLEEAAEVTVTVAGTEGNVMGLLARLGNSTGLVTSLPASPLGRRVFDEYQAAGINTDALVWRETGRLALYFVERSAPPVPSRVVYDRTRTTFTELVPDDVDWDYVLDSRLIHLTGITAALGDNTRDVLKNAAMMAIKAGRELSVDVNYRSQLATPVQAREWVAPLLDLASVISCSRRDADTLFDTRGDVEHVARALSGRFGAPTVLVSDGPRPAAALSGGKTFVSAPPVTTVIDRVGAGDALIGGFLHGHLRGDPETGLRLGISAAALALTRHGEQVRTSLPELEQLADSFGLDIVR